VINSLSFIGSALLLRRTRFDEPHLKHHGPVRLRELVDFSPVVEGARYIKEDARRFATVLVKGGMSLIGTNWVILPILGERVFAIRAPWLTESQGGTLAMSLLMAARGFGAVGGAFLGGTHAGITPSRCRAWILVGFLMGAAGYLGLSVAPSLLLACPALILAHAGSSAIWTASTTLLQQQTEDRFRGRVFSTELQFTMAIIAFSSFSAGYLVDHGLTVRTVAAGTGLAMLVPALAWAWAQRLWR
jgi:hypothetical protein